MLVPAAERVDALNILLMLFSAVLAMVIPFELFLFSYAILGPLHYLTEISWLHDKQYFTKGRYDPIYMLIIGICLSIIFLNNYYHFDLDIPPTLQSNLTWIALLLAVLFVTIKNVAYRIAGIVVIIASIAISNQNTVLVYMTIFLPTLIHVYLFTGLFMLYGALKSKSRTGLISVGVLLLCPVLLMTAFPNTAFYPVTHYGMHAYTGGNHDIGFQYLHIEMLGRFFGHRINATTLEDSKRMWLDAIFHSQKGIIIARLIAFAYTYHYLNWFSKTRVIQWHKVPKVRFAIVILVWLLSIALYIVDYTFGLVWLFFLSFMHVLLELPLNVTSVIGISRSLQMRKRQSKGLVG